MRACSENFISREKNLSKCRCHASRRIHRVAASFRRRASAWAAPQDYDLLDVLRLLTRGNVPSPQDGALASPEALQDYLERLTLADLLACRRRS